MSENPVALQGEPEAAAAAAACSMHYSCVVGLFDMYEAKHLLAAQQETSCSARWNNSSSSTRRSLQPTAGWWGWFW